MKKSLLFLALCTGLARADDWSYSGSNDPSHWGDLKAEYQLCSTGKEQSPVDVRSSSEPHKGETLPLDSWKPAAYEWLNNGHTLQAQAQEPTQALKLDGRDYQLLQFHFHARSEHALNGKYFPLEAHFVTRADGKDLAVVAVFFTPGKENPTLAKLLEKTPAVNEKIALAEPLDIQPLFPADRDHFRLRGSLTTPPCTENVQWLLLRHEVEASPAQLEQLQKLLGDNYRPLQPSNDRPIEAIDD